MTAPRTVGFLLLATIGVAGAADWPQWRGPHGNGAAPGATPPVRWSETENVRWKAPLPGLGHSTPAVWGDRIFLTSAVPFGDEVASVPDEAPGAHHNVPPRRRQRLVVLAIDRTDGSLIWQRTVRELLPHDATHETGSWASASPVTDGKVLVASFGSGGIYGMNLDGELLWQRDLGDMHPKHGHGEGSSPALHGETVVVNWDHEGGSFLVALDAGSGGTRWRVERAEATSWSTPLIVEHDGRAQVIVAATGRVRGYDLADGAVIWQCGGLSGNVVASPVAAGDLVFVGSSYEKRAMLAIRWVGARGEIGGTEAVVWTRDRDTPYVPSPVLSEGTLCFLKHYQNVLTCVEAESGATLHGPRRVEGIRNVYGSPLVAGGRLYVVDLDGNGATLGFGDGFPLLARSRLDESFSASPVAVDDQLVLRGRSHLYLLQAGDDLSYNPAEE